MELTFRSPLRALPFTLQFCLGFISISETVVIGRRIDVIELAFFSGFCAYPGTMCTWSEAPQSKNQAVGPRRMLGHLNE